MIREEEIKYASKDYVNYLLDKQEYHNENYTEYDIQQAFEKGAQWADDNHKSPWISVEESLPKEDSERNDYMSVEVLTITDKGYISLDTYDYQTKRWFIHSEFLVVDENDDSLGEVTHWMPLPKLPK